MKPQPGARAFEPKLLLGRVAGVAGATVGAQALTGLIFVAAARSLDPAAFGVAAVLIAVSTICALVFDAGLSDYLTRETAAGQLSEVAARRINARKRLLLLILLPGLVLAGALVGEPVVESLVAAVLVWSIWESTTRAALARGKEQFAVAAACQLTGRGIGVGAAVVFYLVGFTPSLLILCLIISYFFEATALSVRRRVVQQSGSSTPSPESIHWKAVPFGLSGLLASAQQFDTPIVSAAAGASQAGIYAGAGRLIGPLNFVGSSLRSVAIPWLARAQVNLTLRRAEEVKVLRLSLAAALIPVAAGLAGVRVVPAILGPDYLQSGPTFLVLSVGAAFGTLNQGLVTILQARRLQLAVACCFGFGLSAGLVATYLLAAHGGATAAALGFIVTQVIVLVGLSFTLARRRINRALRRSSHAS